MRKGIFGRGWLVALSLSGWLATASEASCAHCLAEGNSVQVRGCVASDAARERPTARLHSPTVRVLIEHRSPGAMLEVAGRFALVDPKTGRRLNFGLFGQRSAIRPSQEGIVWDRSYPGVYQIKLVPRGEDRVFWLDGVQYQGACYIYQIGQTLSLVNETPIEGYVAAIVESYSGEPLHEEAARALAICARSDAWYHLKTRGESYWHLYAPEVGFHGVGGVSPSSKGAEAAKATRSVYLTHPGFESSGGLFLTRWTKHSAGQTVGYNQLGPERREAGEFSVVSPTAQLDRQSTQWQSILTQEQLEKAFELKGHLQQLCVLRDPTTHKVCALSLKSDQEQRDVSYLRAVQLLGQDRIQSSDFTAELTPSHQYRLVGYGRGDGVGLCLYSADQRARQGKQAPEILEEFFPGSHVQLIKSIE